MAVTTEMPATTTSSRVIIYQYVTQLQAIFFKCKNGVYNCCKTDVKSHGMTGGRVEISLLMGFALTHCTKEGVKSCSASYCLQVPCQWMHHVWC